MPQDIDKDKENEKIQAENEKWLKKEAEINTWLDEAKEGNKFSLDLIPREIVTQRRTAEKLLDKLKPDPSVNPVQVQQLEHRLEFLKGASATLKEINKSVQTARDEAREAAKNAPPPLTMLQKIGNAFKDLASFLGKIDKLFKKKGKTTGVQAEKDIPDDELKMATIVEEPPETEIKSPKVDPKLVKHLNKVTQEEEGQHEVAPNAKQNHEVTPGVELAAAKAKAQNASVSSNEKKTEAEVKSSDEQKPTKPNL